MELGDDRLKAAAEQLVPVLYADLQQIARRERGRAGSPATLQTTAVIHEAYLKLRRSDGFQDRRHFLAAAALAMRQVLVDYARTRLRDKRGGGAAHVSLDEADLDQVSSAAAISEEELLAVNDALTRLAEVDPRMAQVVECRFFAGYDETETAEALDVSARTVRRDWVQAKAWLYRELHPQS